MNIRVKRTLALTYGAYVLGWASRVKSLVAQVFLLVIGAAMMWVAS